MRVLVTGASGFIGTHLLKLLAAEGAEVFTHGPVPGLLGTHFDTPVCDLQALTAVAGEVKPEAVYHLAGLAVASDYNDYYLVNVTYAATLLKALEQAGMPSVPVLLVGTSAEYGTISPGQLPITEDTPPRPYSHYGVSKLAQTQMGQLLAREGRPLVLVRPFNILGTGMGGHLSVQSFARQVAAILQGRQEPVITTGNLTATRDFMDVEDVVRCYYQLMRTPSAYGKVINICSGQPVVMSDLLNRLIRLSGKAIEVRISPQLAKPVDIPEHYGDPARLHSILGHWDTKSLDQSLKEILENLLAA